MHWIKVVKIISENFVQYNEKYYYPLPEKIDKYISNAVNRRLQSMTSRSIRCLFRKRMRIQSTKTKGHLKVIIKEFEAIDFLGKHIYMYLYIFRGHIAEEISIRI